MALEEGIQSLYRPAYELTAAATWGAAAVATGLTSAITTMPSMAGIGMTGVSAAMAGCRGYQTFRLYKSKLALAGNQFWKLPMDEVDTILDKRAEDLWIGRGFRWQAQHTKRAIELGSRELENIMPPSWFLKMMKVPTDQHSIRGESWIHGVEADERELFIPWKHAEGNTAIFGTTGAGKTRLYENLVYQMIRAQDVVIVIDPKFDKDLRDTLKRACVRAGRPEAFLEFHPAFPSKSVRIDLVKNFNRSTEIPTRIADILDGEPGDPFIAFCWRVLAAITDGLLYVDERPSLTKLRAFVEGGPEPLMERVLQRFLDEHLLRWQDMIGEIAQQLRAKKLTTKLTQGSERLVCMAHIYHVSVPAEKKTNTVSGLLGVCEHPREHHGKMVQVLLPLLAKLTASPLDELLSPDYADQDDDRPIIDMEKVIRGKHVLYVATDSLADATVGSAIAAMLLADLRAVAGARYNLGDVPTGRIHIMCDEAYEVVSPPLISILNKGRGAGFVTWMAAQTFSDYVVKFGSLDKARMVLGNCNNIISLRVRDLDTQKYIVESLGTTRITNVSRTKSSGTKTEDAGMEFTGNISEAAQQEEVDLFPPHLLGKLPDLHFVAAVAGGKMFKGRLPLLVN